MRRTAIGLGVSFVLLFAVAATVVAFRFRLATAVASYALGRAGFPEARFEIEQVNRRMIVLARIESGAAMRIERCEISLDWLRLPSLPVERVRIVGARIDVAARGPATVAETTEEAPPAAFPLGLVPALELDDTVATIPSPFGPLDLRIDSRVGPEDGALAMRLKGKVEGKALDAAFDGEARLDEGGAVSIRVRVSALDVRHEKASITGGAASLTIDGTSAGLTLRDATGVLEATMKDAALGKTPVGAIDGKLAAKLERKGGTWTAELTGGDVELRGKRLRASEITGKASAESVKLLVGKLEDTASRRRFEPIAIEMNVQRDKPEPMEFAADVRAARGRATAHAEGRYDATRGVALVDVSVPKLSLGTGRVRLTELSSLLASAGEVAGVVEGNAHLSWSQVKGLSGGTRVKLDGVSVSSPRIRIEGLDGVVTLADLFPPVTPAIQTLRIREMHPGVLFSGATLRWGLEAAKKERGSRLRIEQFETGFAGGKIIVSDTVLDPVAPTNTIVFQLAEIDAVELFKIASLEGVAGTGRLSGSIPVEVRKGAVAIPKAELAAKGGVLQIRSQQAAQMLAGGGQSVDLLLDALQDFHYDDLTVTIEKAFEGDASVKLHLAGQNPAVMNAQPFRINLNLTGNIDRLVASLLEVARLSDQAVRATVNAVKPEGNR